jgi:hypothetical protein
MVNLPMPDGMYREYPLGEAPEQRLASKIRDDNRDPEHPLADQRGQRMFHQILPAVIAKAGRKPIYHADRPIGRAQKQRARIRRHQSGSVKSAATG